MRLDNGHPNFAPFTTTPSVLLLSLLNTSSISFIPCPPVCSLRLFCLSLSLLFFSPIVQEPFVVARSLSTPSDSPGFTIRGLADVPLMLVWQRKGHEHASD
ncbi:unnamed protein product [Mesocestoides corti]|uniref:Ig-like domain-containing protein n=1 Tax=Mesocestoides corti TaxID=53468 RepID=A0A0R3UF28_MESCO|nr:unnamed protein product [Mesocestoides corti]